MPDFRDVEFWTAGDGARLALHRRAAEGPARGAVLLVHGFGDHAGRYPHVADFLAARGLAVYALDQRGHGRSPGRRGHVERFAQYIADVVALRKLAQAEAPGAFVLYGHSFGGLVVLRYLETGPAGVAGAIITCPFLDVSMPVPAWKSALAALTVNVLPSIAVPTGMNLDHLSTDPSVGATVRRDRLSHQVMSPRAWHEIQAAQHLAVAESGRLGPVPLFLGWAGDDRIVSSAATRALASGLGANVTTHEYAGMFHEIHNEPDRDRVFADLGTWLDRLPGVAA